MRRDSPYKGLVPYDEEDAEFFFGRDSLRGIVVANLIASRLTLLYGPSGVGKSSVLRAGVEHHLKELTKREIEKRGKTDFACVVFNSWRDNPIDALERIIESRVSQLTDLHATHSQSRNRPFVEALAEWAKRIGGDIYIVLDQFEEYFLYHPQEDEEGSFAVQFPEAVNRANLRVNFLISIREDALAKLDFFKGRLPGLFDNYLRIDHLDRDAAKEAIEGPIEKYNQRYRQDEPPVIIDSDLTDAVLDQVKAGKLSLGETGGGAVELKTPAELVETPYLQLVMTRLWNEELGEGSTRLRLATLQRLGNAERIVRTHLDETMSSLSPDEQKIAAEAFDYLVTPSGTKIAYYASDLEKYTHFSAKELEPILEKLSSGRILILRKVAVTTDRNAPPRYEIFHDVLAKAVLDWRSRFNLRSEIFENLMADVQERASRWRLGLALIIMLALTVSVLGYLLVSTKRETNELEKRLRALRVAAVAKSKLTTDIDVAVLLAREAVTLADMPETEAILRQSLAQNPSLLTMRADKAAVVSAAFSHDGTFAVLTSHDGVRIWDLTSRKQVAQLKRPASPDVSAISHNSELGVTGSSEGEICIWKLRTAEIVTCFDGHVERDERFNSDVTQVAFSPDDRYIVTAGNDSYVRVWDTLGRSLAALHHDYRVNRVDFSPSGDLIASASNDYTARIWDWKKGDAVFKSLPHDKEVHVAKFSPDGKVIATGSEDGNLRLWDATSGHEILKTTFQIGETKLPIIDLSFSLDGTKIAIASRAYTGTQPTAEIWSLRDKKPAGIEDQPPGALVTNITFSADSDYVLTAYDNGSALISAATTGKVACRYSGNQFLFNSAAFDPDGKGVITVGSSFGVGGMARLWKVCYQQPDHVAWEYSATVPALMEAVNERIGRELTNWERDAYVAP